MLFRSGLGIQTGQRKEREAAETAHFADLDQNGAGTASCLHSSVEPWIGTHGTWVGLGGCKTAPNPENPGTHQARILRRGAGENRAVLTVPPGHPGKVAVTDN